jgi:alpha-tubulin suppressor-like RCC1 family protein
MRRYLPALLVLGAFALGACLLPGARGAWAASAGVKTSKAAVTIKEISGGANHTCILRSDHKVKCWGANGYGQLGDGTTTDRHTAVLVRGVGGVGTLANVKYFNWAIAAGHSDLGAYSGRRYGAGGITTGLGHTCAVVGSVPGKAVCWGSNAYGQLGNGTTANSTTPVPVSGLTSVVKISAGGHHTCAISGSFMGGKIYCWGDNSYGQLGNGSTVSSTTPVEVPGITNAIAISAGLNHTCAILGWNQVTVRKVECWGLNDHGQLGNKSFTNSSVPRLVVKSAAAPTAALTTVEAITAGSLHTCAALANETVRCWGADNYGQLGNGTHMATGGSATPVVVKTSPTVATPLKGATAVSAGANFTCAVGFFGSAGGFKCWGAGGQGQLDSGSTANRYAPVYWNSKGFSLVGTGGMHTCALPSDGKLVCSGMNQNGQLGDGTTVNRRSPVHTLAVP